MKIEIRMSNFLLVRLLWWSGIVLRRWNGEVPDELMMSFILKNA
jgi:hypothetical protein